MTLAPFSARPRGGGQRIAPPVYRWSPYRDIEDINERFNQLIRTFFGDSSTTAGAATWPPMAPPVDVEETDDAYVVDVDLPNVNPDDVMVEMSGEELRISGEFQQRERTGVLRRQNRPAGEFEYLVDLPNDIDPNRVDAMYESGVLTIMVGKARDARPRRIEVHGGPRRQQQMGQGEQQRPGMTEG
jgi:HSP20 family protein